MDKSFYNVSIEAKEDFMKPFLLKKLVPVPKIEDHKIAVFIGPHPDDIEIACGATIAKLKRLGVQVHFIIITDGQGGSTDETLTEEVLISTRSQESMAGATVFGVDSIENLNYPDGGIYEVNGVAHKLVKRLIALKPDIVFSPDPRLPSEIHPDHLKAGEAATLAIYISQYPSVMKIRHIDYDIKQFQPIPPTLAYYYTDRPNQRVIVTDKDCQMANQAILKHQSQFQESSPAWKSLNQYLWLRRHRMAGLFHRMADGYRVLGPVHQHCFPEINEY